MIDETLPVALNQIISRVQFQEEMIFFGDESQAPENRRSPETKLQNHCRELPDIAEENCDRTREPRNSQREANHREKIIQDLQVINRDGIAVSREHHEEYADKKNMHDQSRHNFYDWEQLDSENNFFHEETALYDGSCRADDAVAEKKPREHSADEPKHKRKIVYGHGLEADLKNEPENDDGNRRLNERPQNSEIRAEITLAEIAFSHLPQKFSVMNYFANQRNKRTKISQEKNLRLLFIDRNFVFFRFKSTSL